MPPKRGSIFVVSSSRIYWQSDELSIRCPQCIGSIFRKAFFSVLLKKLDRESSLYKVPLSDRAVGVPIIVDARLPCCPLRTRRNAPGYSKALALRTRLLLAILFQ
jgi:hypothetical protein